MKQYFPDELMAKYPSLMERLKEFPFSVPCKDGVMAFDSYVEMQNYLDKENKEDGKEKLPDVAYPVHECKKQVSICLRRNGASLV